MPDDDRRVYVFVESFAVWRGQLDVVTPNRPALVFDVLVWGGSVWSDGYSVCVSQSVHFTVQGFPSIHRAVEFVSVSFHPFSCPFKWGVFKKVPNGVDNVKRLV
jgi:hypothetical protein